MTEWSKEGCTTWQAVDLGNSVLSAYDHCTAYDGPDASILAQEEWQLLAAQNVPCAVVDGTAVYASIPPEAASQ